MTSVDMDDDGSVVLQQLLWTDAGLWRTVPVEKPQVTIVAAVVEIMGPGYGV